MFILLTVCSVCGITIRRTTLIPFLFASRDRTWDAIDDYLWSYAEMNAGIVCASVPSLKPLFVHCLPRCFKSRIGTKRSIYSRRTYSSNSIVEQNRSRRKMQNESFQLSSIEDSKHGRNYSYDEAVHLWHGSSRDAGLEKAVLVASRPIMGLPSSSREELRGDEVVYDVRATAASPRPIRKSGITVTRETVIRYEREW